MLYAGTAPDPNHWVTYWRWSHYYGDDGETKTNDVILLLLSMLLMGRRC